MEKTSKTKKNLSVEWAPINLLESIEDGIAVVDVDLRVVYANAINQSEFGDDIAGKYCYEVFVDRNSACSNCPVLESIASGKPALAQKASLDKRGQRIIVDIKASPLKDAAGQVIGAIEVSRNVTERKLIEEEADRRGREIVALAETAMALNKSIELEEVLNIAMQQAVEVFNAIGGTIRLLDRSGQKLITRSWHTKTEDAMPKQVEADQVLGVGIVGKAAADKRTVFVKDMENIPGLSDSAHGKSLLSLGVRSMVIVPLVAKDKLLGTLALGSKEKNRFTDESKNLIEAIASQVAISIENANLLKKAREDAGRD